MLKNFSLFVALCSLSLTALAKPILKPSDHIPKGYVLFETTKGDLNNDGIDDIVLMVKATKKSAWLPDQWDTTIVDKNRRGLMIFLSKKSLQSKADNSYHLVLQNLNCFASENENGGVYYPPDLLLEISKNKLFVSYLHGRYGSWEYQFRLNNQKNDFNLIGYDSSSNHGPIINRTRSVNFLTKKMNINTNKNPYEDPENAKEEFYEEWFSIPKDLNYKLSNINDFYDLDIGSLNYDKSKYNNL